MTTNDTDAKIIELRSKTSPVQNNPFISLASKLIADHSTQISPEPKQNIVGSNNIQLAIENVTIQSIEGDGNIQICGENLDVERRITQIEKLLKK